MPKISPFSKINCYLALAHLFFCLTILPGCATSPVIKMPEAMPDIVREYKSVKIYGFNSGLVNTGVRVKKGDYYTIMASGEIHYRLPRAPIFSVGPDVILYWQEGKEYPYPYSYSGGNNYLRASRSGIIFLSILPLPGGGGSFSVDIIIWKKKDPVLIGNFFNDLVSKDPQNRILNNFANYFRTEKDILLAEQKAAKEIEETQKALMALKKEAPEKKEEKPKPAVANSQAKEIKQTKKEEPMPQLPIVSPKLQEEKKFTSSTKEKEIPRVKDSIPTPEKQPPGIKDVEKEKKIAELDERLQKAMQALNDLEDMKKKMAEQQKKVEEQRGKEQVLTARLDALEKGKSMPSQTPPLIAIANPKDGISVDSEYISFAGVAEHEKGIIKFEIMVNNEPVTFKDQRGLKIVPKEQKRIEFSERIRLREGKNELTIIAQEKEGQTAKKTISIQMTKKQEEIWAVVIGINKYLNLPSLKYAVNDGKEFYRYLVEVNKIPKDHIWLLLDEEATLDKLRSVLGTQLRRKAGKDDMVIIYLAGHGATEKDATSLDGDGLEKYILPHNADPKDLYASAMPMGEVSRIFDRISSEKLVFLSDTCYSGATGGRTIPVMGRRANVSGAFLDRLSQGKGRVIITASDANQVSAEKDELKHGVFTYYLLEGLRGKADMDGDGFVTVDEIYRYVSIKVPQATGQDQHPVKKGEMKGQIVLGVAR